MFFTTASSNGDYALAFRHGLLITIAFVLVALVVALVDVTADNKIGRRIARRFTHR
ncbi:hypothetical protein ACFQX6_18390 [Streptosporangium lutulentum]